MYREFGCSLQLPWYKYGDSRREMMKMLSASSSVWGSSGGSRHSHSFPSDLLFLHRSTWSLSFCTAHTSPRSTSGIYNYSSTPSQLCAPPQPGRTLRRASCSSAFPICSSSCPFWGIRGPLCPASQECGFPGSNRGSLPGGPAPCGKWSWRSRQWPPGWLHCSQLLGGDPPSELCDTSPSSSSPPPWTLAAAASRSAWCSYLTPRGTYMSSAWFPLQPGGTEKMRIYFNKVYFWCCVLDKFSLRLKTVKTKKLRLRVCMCTHT